MSTMVSLQEEAINRAREYIQRGWNRESVIRQLHWELGDFTDDTDSIIAKAFEIIDSPLYAIMEEK